MFNYIQKIIGAWRLFKSAYRNHTRKLIITTLIGFLSGLLGGIGISIIIPVFALLTNASSAVPDPISKIIREVFTVTHIPYTLASLFILVGTLLALKAAFLYLSTYINNLTSSKYEEETRTELWREVLASDWPHLMTQRLGYLQSVILEDVQGTSAIFTAVGAIILTLTNLIVYAFIALQISPFITIVTLVIGMLLFFLYKPLYYRVRKSSQTISDTIKSVAHHINEHILGAKTVKATAVEKEVLNQSKVFFAQLREARIRQEIYSALFSTFIEPISFIFLIIIFSLSYHKAGFNIASFIATMYLVQKIFNFVQVLQSRISNINTLLPPLQNVLSYRKNASQAKEQANGSLPYTFSDSLSFKDVSFAYNETTPVLKDVSFQVNHGQTVGIIGPSGGGKTTIVDLLLRLLQPNSGSIVIDNENVEAIDMHEWRHNISYVSQDIFVLNDTIENNIRFYDSKIEKADIVNATKTAAIYDFIMSLPDGFQTMVGEHGVRLSGGQRQRVILARALARKPKILILDEATSALDNESEAAIQKAIHELKGTLTIIIIAHRLSTIMNADELFVIDQGKIMETGTPQNLLSDESSYFHKMVNLYK